MIRFDIGVKEGKEKGKTFHLESEADLAGTKLGEIIKGEKIDSRFHGFEFKITGASDSAGFPSLIEVEGSALKRKILEYGKGMKQKRPYGLRQKKSIRGNTISSDTAQVNLAVIKYGNKSLSEILGKEKKEEKEEKKEEK